MRAATGVHGRRNVLDEPTHAITSIERVMTDNAFAYRHGRAFFDAVQYWREAEIHQTHCPWHNGKVCEYRWWCWTVLA